jgi:hypothetical protein
MVLSALFAFLFAGPALVYQVCRIISLLGNSSDVDANIVCSLLSGMPCTAQHVRNTVIGNDTNIIGAET